jgi:hypothetical protein
MPVAQIMAPVLIQDVNPNGTLAPLEQEEWSIADRGVFGG